MDDALGEQLHLTADLVRQRISMGDRGEVPRDVDHFAFFRKGTDAEAAAAELTAHGYAVEVRKRMLRSDLHATHHSAVDAADAAMFTRDVFTVITRHHGVYDGWGAPLVTET